MMPSFWPDSWRSRLRTAAEKCFKKCAGVLTIAARGVTAECTGNGISRPEAAVVQTAEAESRDSRDDLIVVDEMREFGVP